MDYTAADIEFNFRECTVIKGMESLWDVLNQLKMAMSKAVS